MPTITLYYELVQNTRGVVDQRVDMQSTGGLRRNTRHHLYGQPGESLQTAVLYGKGWLPNSLLLKVPTGLHGDY